MNIKADIYIKKHFSETKMKGEETKGGGADGDP